MTRHSLITQLVGISTAVTPTGPVLSLEQLRELLGRAREMAHAAAGKPRCPFVSRSGAQCWRDPKHRGKHGVGRWMYMGPGEAAEKEGTSE